MKTLLAAMILALPVATRAQDLPALQGMFAQCAGRYSAEMEHAWLIDTTKAQDHRDRRLQFLSLLDATTHRDHTRHVLHTWVETKAAHAALLGVATFVKDRARAAAAHGIAQAHLRACRTLLLDG